MIYFCCFFWQETLRIQVDRLEMRMQINMRRLVSELQTDMQNRVCLHYGILQSSLLHMYVPVMKTLSSLL